MKNFEWETFTKKIAVRADISTIYNAWAIPSEIERWFLKHAEYFSDYDKKLKPLLPISTPCTYNWSWYGYNSIEKGKITLINGKDQIQFSFAGDCVVDVNLSGNIDYTIVTLTQKNIPTDDKSKKNIRLGCDSGWSFYLVNLKSVYEGGLDLRNKEEKLKGMINS